MVDVTEVLVLVDFISLKTKVVSDYSREREDRGRREDRYNKNEDRGRHRNSSPRERRDDRDNRYERNG